MTPPALLSTTPPQYDPNVALRTALDAHGRICDTLRFVMAERHMQK
jgi:hypothetical protein